MLGRLKLIAVSALSVTLLCGGPAAAQTPPPDSLAAAKELVVTMRAADQLKNLLPVIMQQLKPAIVLGRPQIEKDYDAIMPRLDGRDGGTQQRARGFDCGRLCA